MDRVGKSGQRGGARACARLGSLEVEGQALVLDGHHQSARPPQDDDVEGRALARFEGLPDHVGGHLFDRPRELAPIGLGEPERTGGFPNERQRGRKVSSLGGQREARDLLLGGTRGVGGGWICLARPHGSPRPAEFAGPIVQAGGGLLRAAATLWAASRPDAQAP